VVLVLLKVALQIRIFTGDQFTNVPTVVVVEVFQMPTVLEGVEDQVEEE
jgi:hypothetical protein